AGLFYATEWEMCLGTDGWSVDIRDAVVELVHRAHRDVHVARVHGRRQTVLHVIVDRERLVRRPEANDGENRTEDLLLLETHPCANARKDCWLEEVSVVEAFPCRAISPANQVRPFFLSDVDVALHLINGILVDEGTDVGSRSTTVAKLQ